MKKSLLIAACIAFVSISNAADEGSTPLPDKGKATATAPVDFQGELPVADTHAAALVRAKKEKRLVMTIFASSACPHCTAFRKGF